MTLQKKHEALQYILNKTIDNKRVFGTSFAIRKENSTWIGHSGDISVDQAYFIASTTKLFTVAIILHLRATGKLNLEDKIGSFLDSDTLKGLHIYNGKEYSGGLTIKHLLAHTSGLPDYFQGKNRGEKSLEDELKSGKDQFWTFEQAIESTKALKPHFL